LPVLRVKYADPPETWLYLDPQHGTMMRQERMHSKPGPRMSLKAELSGDCVALILANSKMAHDIP